MGQLVLSAVGAVVGGVVGFFVGGPAGVAEGAELGWMAGGIAGGLIFRQHGPSPQDIRIQDSAYGKPIPFVYGMYRAAGNIIWAGQPFVSNGGKGGKGPTQTQVSMSFAVGLCAGPIAGIRRIWANGQLIYDVSDPSNFQAVSGSANMVTGFNVYPGDELQEPDPIMQGALGVGATPAYRGLAYVVFNELNLSQWGNYLPSLSFEILQSPYSGSYNDTAATYTYVTSIGTYFSMPCLTASGGQAMAAGYYFGFNGYAVATVGPYGANQTAILHPAGLSGAGYLVGSSDVEGIWTGQGWLHPVGTFDDLSAAGTLNLGTANSGANFWRNGDDMFMSSNYGPTQLIYRLDINQKGLVVATSIAGQWTLIGGSASYVYATEAISGHLYQFDRLTLAVTQIYTGLSFATDSPGCVVDDDHIYFANAQVQLFRPSQNTLVSLGLTGFSSISVFQVINANFFVFADTGYGNSMKLGYMWISQGQVFTTLSDIVADICTRSGMSSGQYDVSQLTDTVNGYAVTNHSPARNNLNPLMAAFFFDACDTDGEIKFTRRGSQPVGTFAYADLGASPNIADDANNTPITEIITQEVDLPRSLQFTYPELDSDYNPNTQRWARAYTNSNKDTVMTAPIVFSAADAQARTEAMLWSAWVGRKTFQFTTGLSYLQYEPGDVMTLEGPNGEAYIIRITRCQYDGQGTLIWTAMLEEPDIYPNPSYTTGGGVAAGFRAQQIPYSGPTVIQVLDIPPLRSGDTSQGVYLAACGLASDWPGAAIDLSRDGSTFSQLFNMTGAATMGYALSALPNFGGGNQPDELSTVSVYLYNGALSSVAYSDFLNGLNACCLGGEIIFFRTATQTAANTYTLTGLMRGMVGTEYAMATHAVGEPFTFLDAANVAAVPLLLTDINATLYFEPFLLNLFGQTPGSVVQCTPTNARVKPLSPALFVAGHGSTSATADITLSWIRRARVNAAWLDGADVPLDESAENYTLTIYNGATLVRTVLVSGTGDGATVIYSAANITADGFTTGNTITFNVQQNSDQGVLGHAATTTITR
jgi:hypothetical protein